MPATVVIKDGGADLRNLSLSLSGGRLTIEGRAGSKLDLKAIARAVPLSAADILAPDIGLSGVSTGRRRLPDRLLLQRAPIASRSPSWPRRKRVLSDCR